MKNDYKDFSLRLKEERIRYGLTQQPLCDFTKMQQSSFSRVEAGYIRLTYPKLKRFCTSGMDIFYVFTGNRATNRLDFLELSKTTPEELLYLLSIVYIHASGVQTQNRTFPRASENTLFKVSREASFEQIRKQLSYLQCLSGGARTNRNIFYCLRNYYGYTQGNMADLLGIDIKKLRNLEKGRRLPDSELIWKMYEQFHLSPAFILNDPRGLWSELNYVLGLLGDDDRRAILRILEGSHNLVWE